MARNPQVVFGVVGAVLVGAWIVSMSVWVPSEQPNDPKVLNMLPRLHERVATRMAGVPVAPPCVALNIEEMVSGCPHDALLLAEWATLRPNHNWTIVDIGANKGYNIADYLSAIGLNDLYNRELHVAKLIAFAKNLGEVTFPKARRPDLCGTCSDCVGKSPTPRQEDVFLTYTRSRPKDFRVFAVDCIKSHIDFLLVAYPDRLRFEFRLAAASNVTGRTTITQTPFGEESAGMLWDVPKAVASQAVEALPALGVPLVVPDQWLAGVADIDVLVTDTEGFDLVVAQGTRRLLMEGRVGLYLFELGGKRLLHETLPTFMSDLFVAGYSCYLAVGHGPGIGRNLVPVNLPGCWRDRYVQLEYMNIICGNRKHPDLIDVLESWTHRYLPHTRASVDAIRQQRPAWDFEWMLEGWK